MTWLKTCLEKYQQIPQRISIINKLSGNDTLYADPQLLKQALTNLIDNAMKHGSTLIQVTAKIEAQDIVLQVADDGTPIPESDRQFIFQPFTQLADDKSPQTAGFGLGLAIVETIVTAHHGELIISDTDLGGACFTIRLPIESRRPSETWGVNNN